MSTFNPLQQYGFVRGFNFQPDWGSNGTAVWLKFDRERYRELIACGKELFPKMNTLRIWLSFDAWCEDPDSYLSNLKDAADIITEEGLRFIPVYFNGWFGIPVFGGFVPGQLSASKKTDDYANFRAYLRQSVQAVSSGAILLHDVSNEPFNNAWGHQQMTEIVYDFLREMCKELRKVDDRPLTIGSQGSVRKNKMEFPQITSKWGDIDLLAPFVDVVTLHPYCIPPMTADEHLRALTEVVEYIGSLCKPVIITECCWSGKTDEEHLSFIRTELPHYAQLGIGFIVHALSESPVADLHPLDDGRALGCLGLYMAFMDRNGQLRNGHELYNLY